jgi:hypothetical protein
MASPALLVSTVVMGVLLVALAVTSTRFEQGGGYRPHLAEHLGRGPDASSLVSSNAFALALAALLLVVLGAGVATGNAGLVLLAVPPAAVAGYFAWGVYHTARTRGLPVAHAVGLSAWLVGVLLVGVVATNLVVG